MPTGCGLIVSIHAPAWGATSSRYARARKQVSIHAPAWGATDVSAYAVDYRRFNPRARVGRDVVSMIPRPGMCFNPRARVGRDWRRFSNCLCEVFQSTRPRGARRDAASTLGGHVSIHAPAWGATCAMPWIDGPERVSIHAPAWGATSTSRRHRTCFNPRARVGRDGYSCWWPQSSTLFQSTRPRGARHVFIYLLYRPSSRFNPRARVGRDAHRSCLRSATDVFQSTRPRGARRWRFRITARVAEFQSTRPRGARRERLQRSQASCKFQSTRPRGARQPPTADTILAYTMFQSTRPRGARRQLRPSYAHGSQAFQSTRPRGARRSTAMCRRRYMDVSIHAPAWGATIAARSATHVTQAVSIHAPAWGATRATCRAIVGSTVSIHAPAWGATLAHDRTIRACTTFQSTRPRGARPAPADARRTVRTRFNPRARVGRDSATSLLM